MHKILSVFVVFASTGMLLGACCTTPTPDENQVTPPVEESPSSTSITVPDGFVNYTSTKYGISVQHPSDWTVTEDFMSTVSVMIGSPAKDSSDALKENVSIIVQDLSASPVTLAEFDSLNRAELASAITDFSLLNSGDCTINGIAGKFVEYTGTQGKLSLKLYQAWTIDNNMAYVYTFTAGVETYDEYKATSDAILSSLTW